MHRIKIHACITAVLLAALLALTACNLPGEMPGDANTGTSTSTTGSNPQDNPVNADIPSPTEENTAPRTTSIPTVAARSLWVAPYLPADFTNGLVAPFPLMMVEDPAGADLKMDFGEGDIVTRVIYALAAPFPTMKDQASSENLQKAWAGSAGGSWQSAHLYVSEATYVVFTRIWGPADDNFVQILPEDQLLSGVWQEGSAYALLPFEQLEPRWKVLTVDGDNPIWKTFNPESYSLGVPVAVSGGDPALVSGLVEALSLSLPSPYNRDSNKLTTVVLTGVTALVRATAAEMETFGINYPSLDIGDMLREADILHVSNEVPFAPNCPTPNPSQPNLVFCSSPDYMTLFETIGTDVIELTGDHFGDWGTAAVLYTLDLYDQQGLVYYGGGETVAEAQAPVFFDHNGNQIAFVGCNAKGGSYTPLIWGLPGAVDCRFSDLVPQLNQLDQDGYVVIMTFQHFEYYYFDPNFILEEDFRLVADAGADIVSGSQAHQPHGIEFYNGSALFYGLGNLFFDQLLISEDTARALIARHVIYDNRHISSELITVYFEDFSRPRYLLGEGRDDLLKKVFSASEWGGLILGD